MQIQCDVLIIGGGPAGSTLGSLLRRYDRKLKVLIAERETFPRDHVGESQLPPVCAILNEIGVWDKVEAAGFPVKVGSTYRWGSSEDLWQLNFIPEEYTETQRPGRFSGQRARLAFQVERSTYDKILLDHARELGCEVRESCKATAIRLEGDRVESVDLNASGESVNVKARYYVDASGASGLFPRALGIESYAPTDLRNIAFWDYWQDAEWAETIGKNGTRVQVMSLGWGWLWFIPVSDTRTSIGLVLPTEHFKSSGKKAEEVYREAIASEPRISALLGSATCEQKFQTTRDWNFVSNRLAGENWFLAGDSCGFADPILAAGMTLAQVSARKVACTILESDRGRIPLQWLRDQYDERHRKNIEHHIRFAEFWYSANGCFTDLQKYCVEIARSAGIDLTPEGAFQWLATGGFATDFLMEERSIAFGFLSAKGMVGRFVGGSHTAQVMANNVFDLDINGATEEPFAVYLVGRVFPARAFRRAQKVLPLIGLNKLLFETLSKERDATRFSNLLWNTIVSDPKEYPAPGATFRGAIEVLEALISDGWVKASLNPDRKFLNIRSA